MIKPMDLCYDLDGGDISFDEDDIKTDWEQQDCMDWEPTGDVPFIETWPAPDFAPCEELTEEELDEQLITQDARAIARQYPGGVLAGEADYRDFFRRARLDRERLRGLLWLYLERIADGAADAARVRARYAAIVDMHVAFMALDRDAIYGILRCPHGGPKMTVPGLRVRCPDGEYLTTGTDVGRVSVRALTWIAERAIRRFALELQTDPARFL